MFVCLFFLITLNLLSLDIPGPKSKLLNRCWFFFLIPFQIGRSTESPIDFVVTDTVPGSQSNSDTQSVQSTISRFACRIICERNPPFTARIYAAGFDSSKNIFLGVREVFLFSSKFSAGRLTFELIHSSTSGKLKVFIDVTFLRRRLRSGRRQMGKWMD